MSNYAKETLSAANRSLSILNKNLCADVGHDIEALKKALKATDKYFTTATEGLLKFAKDHTASTEERNN